MFWPTPQTKAYIHLHRWFDFVNSFFGTATKSTGVTLSSNGPSANSSVKQLSKGKYQPLPGAVEGQVITRFPPEPSGWLHLGHAKAALLNDRYATVYKGKLLLRFDDTNPAKESIEFTNSIMEDLQTLEITHHSLTYTSDYFDLLESHAEKFIKDGNAYIDKSTNDEIKLQRRNFAASPFRDSSVEENLRLWEEMKKGSAEGLASVLRAKIDYKSKNGCLRDPAIYRCVISPPHHRTGSKYKVYPLYDFACPIIDSIEGVTHALRSNEYHDRNHLYDWFLKTTGVREVKIADYSRLGFSFTLLSKRKLQWFVTKGHVEGWNSPAFPTVRGMLRRGLTVDALRTYIYSQGSSLRGTLQGMDKLWSVNKQMIDKVVRRYVAIRDEGKVLVELTNGPEKPYLKTVPFHKQNPELGTKVTTFSNRVWIEGEDAAILKPNEEFTLMDWGNCIVRKIERADGETGKVTKIVGELHLEGDYKKTEWKLTWIADVKDIVAVKLVQYGPLIVKPKLEKDDDVADFVNKNIKNEFMAIGDPNLRLLKKGERLQLERRGYWICEEAFWGFAGKDAVELIMIPDGSEDTPSHLTPPLKREDDPSSKAFKGAQPAAKPQPPK
eukprot:TRINITY_DN6495_c0_g3_i1.p1 TRINITY_DN6495_c0_g3~~TRINITY_DN6495_c0_g3_i1.p1  ORF type:complete len:609 (-),score=180.43 TRINITY_DN6495_c0_g3_i1:31-1857(-)